nr:pyruvate, phosphate dikinase, chloroplastic isoform X1 [Tanacetum cinerariifolium]
MEILFEPTSNKLSEPFSALENGIASTSTPYWDTEDDDDCGHQNISLHDKKDLTFIGFVFVRDVVVLKDPEQSNNYLARRLAEYVIFSLLTIWRLCVFVMDVVVLKDPEQSDNYLAQRLAAIEGYDIVVIRGVAMKVFTEMGFSLECKAGTMIEIPRIAKDVEFFSFGTNDLTQMTFGYSRDDVGKFLHFVMQRGSTLK